MTARTDMDEDVLDQAIAWHHALAHEDADWDAYLAWIEANPAHRRAFDEIALLDRLVDERAPALGVIATIPPVEAGRAKSWRMWWSGGAVAAALAIAVALPTMMSSPDMVYQSGAKATTARLAYGTVVELAPRSKLIASHGDARQLALAQGEAFFTVEHDPRRTLSLSAGAFKVSDIGTKFGVKMAADTVAVSVAEGYVSVTSAMGATRQLAAGEEVVGRDGQLSQSAKVAAEGIGSWRIGRVVYDRTPLRVVAADLARYTGKIVRVDPAIRDRQFSGVLSIGDGSRLFQNLSDLMDISYQVQGDNISLSARPSR